MHEYNADLPLRVFYEKYSENADSNVLYGIRRLCRRYCCRIHNVRASNIMPRECAGVIRIHFIVHMWQNAFDTIFTS